MRSWSRLCGQRKHALPVMNACFTAFRSSHQLQLTLPSSESQRTSHSTPPSIRPDWDWSALGPNTPHPGPDFHRSQSNSETLCSGHEMKSEKQRQSFRRSQERLQTQTQLLSVRPGTQPFKPYLVPLTSGVVMELEQHVLGQSREVAVFFIRASPGEVVAAEVVAEAEAAGRVWFNCLWRHIQEEADMNRHSVNTGRHAPYCGSEVRSLLSAACRCWCPRCCRGTCWSSAGRWAAPRSRHQTPDWRRERSRSDLHQPPSVDTTSFCAEKRRTRKGHTGAHL